MCWWSPLYFPSHLFTSSISHPPLPSGALQSASTPLWFFPPMWCDPGLRALGGESLSLPFKDTIGREVQAKMKGRMRSSQNLETWQKIQLYFSFTSVGRNRETSDNGTDKWSWKWFLAIGLNWVWSKPVLPSRQMFLIRPSCSLHSLWLIGKGLDSLIKDFTFYVWISPEYWPLKMLFSISLRPSKERAVFFEKRLHKVSNSSWLKLELKLF